MTLQSGCVVWYAHNPMSHENVSPNLFLVVHMCTVQILFSGKLDGKWMVDSFDYLEYRNADSESTETKELNKG